MPSVVIVPPPRIGGGPSNAVLRISNEMSKNGTHVTTNVFSAWDSALLNVGLGVRYKVLKLLRFGRRVVYRADGCYVREIFAKEGNPWLPEYDQINNQIKTALKTCDFVIYQSQFAKSYLDQLHTRPSGTWAIIHNGVDLNTFSPMGRRKGDIPTVGCIGTFRLNRVRTITDISRRIAIPHRLLLVGRLDNQCRKDLIEFQMQYPDSVVEYVSPIQNELELARVHKRIDCFVHPFLSDWCPNSVIEALASGTPVVVPTSTGGSELVEDGGINVSSPRWIDYAAFLEEYAAAVANVIANHEIFSSRARQRSCRFLDIKDVAQRYIDVLFPDKVS